jgi:hypothetical protein
LRAPQPDEQKDGHLASCFGSPGPLAIDLSGLYQVARPEFLIARVAELADAADSKSAVAIRVGSIPTPGTNVWVCFNVACGRASSFGIRPQRDPVGPIEWIVKGA